MYTQPIERNPMDNPHVTDTGTSIMLLTVTGLLKIWAWLTASKLIAALTIVSLCLAIIYHAFGVYERYLAFKKNRKTRTP